MDMQHHCMGAADQQRNYVHNYTTSLHPRHPYDAVVYSYEIKWSKLKFNKPIKVQGLKTFKDQKSSGTISFRGNLVRDQNNQNRTKKKYLPIKEHRNYSVKFKACHLGTEKLFQCKETNNETRYFQASCSNKNWRPIENNHALNDHAILQYDKENFEFFFHLTTSLAKLREPMKNMFFLLLNS